MLETYFSLAGVEIANSARLATYLETVGSPLDSWGTCGCETFSAETVGDAPYSTPEEDAAPWYDPDVPESADFAGLMVLSAEGLNANPVVRTATAAVTGGAALGPARIQPLTITVTAVLLGVSCCGVEYGLRWLAQALAGTTGTGCGGDCLEFFNCCPGDDEDPDTFTARHRRTLRRVALISGPEVTDQVGSGCKNSGGCSFGADVLTVEFVLTAGTPWSWTDPMPVLEVPVPTDDGTECVTWCIHGGATDPFEPMCMEVGEATCGPGGVLVELTDGACDVSWPAQEPGEGPCDKTCRLATCPDMTALCSDPACLTPTPPVPPPPETCFCFAVAVNEAYYELDLSALPSWFGSAPMIDVTAGSHDLRHVSIKFFERTADHAGLTCEEVAELERCDPAGVFEVSYVPAGGVLTLDGQIERAMVECGGSCETSPDAYGQGGGPLAFPLLTAGTYCVEVSADALFTPADDATISIALSGRGY